MAVATSVSRIRLSPTRKVRDAGAGKRRYIGGRGNPAFGDNDTILRNARCETPRRREVGDEGVEVAVVDADERAFERERGIELGFVVDLDQPIHAERFRGRDQPRRLVGGHHRHDDEDAIGAAGARFRDLVGLEHKVFAQDRQPRGSARLTEEAHFALEARPVRQNGEARRAAVHIGFGERGHIEVGADEPARWAGTLDLGDEPGLALRFRSLQRLQESAPRRGCACRLLDRRGRVRALGCGDLRTFVLCDLGEDAHFAMSSEKWMLLPEPSCTVMMRAPHSVRLNGGMIVAVFLVVEFAAIFVDAPHLDADVRPRSAVAMMLRHINEGIAARDAHEQRRVVAEAVFEIDLEARGSRRRIPSPSRH